MMENSMKHIETIQTKSPYIYLLLYQLDYTETPKADICETEEELQVNMEWVENQGVEYRIIKVEIGK